MAQKVINLGALPNGAGGDTNRSANVKCNENFAELYGATTDLQKTTTDLGATRARKGANSDITALSGLTTALSIAQGGTGARSGQDACINIGAVRLSAANPSYGTTLKNGRMQGISGLTNGEIGGGPLTLDNDGNQHASCVLTLHRGNSFVCYFGLDTDNRLKVGGGSMVGRAYTIYHEGNTTRAPDGTLKAI